LIVLALEGDSTITRDLLILVPSSGNPANTAETRLISGSYHALPGWRYRTFWWQSPEKT
jgi:hypothetical protein